ncbi:MAG TPA: hypothetical protein VHN20_07935, partial [Beijerinckiaceae bacterium]|nr:hypothetical protein [Beijerinckiaceae bacterium]
NGCVQAHWDTARVHARRLAILAAIGRRRLIAVVGGAVITGVAVGYIAGQLLDGGRSEPLRPLPAAEAPRLDPTIRRGVLQPARSASGKRRRRARVSLTVSLRNATGSRSEAIPAPALLVGTDWIRVDPAAVTRARGLLKPIQARQTATGVLRFETAGSVTAHLARTRRTKLRIAGRTLNVSLSAPSNSSG